MRKTIIKKITAESYFKILIERLEVQGKYATARNYKTTWSSFSKFLNGNKLYITDLNGEIVQEYNRYLSLRTSAKNTISFYNRFLRSAYRKAIRDGYAVPKLIDPFIGVYSGVASTRKRALTPSVLRKIASMKLFGEMDFSRDMFLFSFYSRGMCFVDIAHLSEDQLCNDTITYIRSKTGQVLSVHIEPCMQKIIDKWRPHSSGDKIFPIIHSTDPFSAYKEYSYKLARHNLTLKKIGQELNLPFPLNSYAARHSWATLARNIDVPISVISSGLGHTTERTTRIYLASMGNSTLDRANRKVIRSVID